MITADLFAPDFPHATKEGYDRGCRGAGCPGGIDAGMTCTQVFRRYSGDYAFKKKIDAGQTVIEILTDEKRAANPDERWIASVVQAVEKHELVGKDASGELCSCGHRAASLIEHLGTVTLEAAGVNTPAEPQTLSKPKGEKKPIEHGTTAGYSRGCHDGTQCPKGPDGKSCREAYQEYQREYARRRKENAGKPLKGAEHEVAPAAPPVVVPKPAPPTAKPPVSPAPVTSELDLARKEIATLREQIRVLSERLAEQAAVEVRNVEPDVKHAEVTLADGLTVSINVTVGRAAA